MRGLFRWALGTHFLAGALAAAICSPAPLQPNDNQKGTLNEHDCRMADAFPNEPGDNAWVDVYTIAIPEAGILGVEASSSQFNAMVRLYDGRDRRLGGGGAVSRMRAEVQPGQYIVYVTSTEVRTGTYTVASSFKATPGCIARRLSPYSKIHGDLSLGDCRHPISLKQRGTLIVQLQAADAELILRQGREELQRDPARIARELAGDYSIVVHPLRPRAGAYDLRTIFCPGVQDLALNTQIEGRVSNACRDTIGDGPQIYTLKLAAGAVVSVDVQSSGIEPQVSISGPGIVGAEARPPLTRALRAGVWSLALRFSKGSEGVYSLTARRLCPLTEIQTNSAWDGAFTTGGCHSDAILNAAESSKAVVYDLRTEQTCQFTPEIEPKGIARPTLLDLAFKPVTSPLLSPGEYLVLVSALAPDAHSFRLETGCRRVCLPSELSLNETQDGRLWPNNCRVGDFVPSDEASPANSYRLNLARKTTVLLELPDADSTASLMLWKGEGDKMERLEESRSIRSSLESGGYLVVVKAPGPLAYKLRAAVLCIPTTLQTDEPVSSTISDADCYDSAGFYYRRYRILPDQNAVLELAAASKSFDPVLSLSDQNASLTVNTGAAGERAAAIRYVVESGGEYTAQVKAESPAAGAFDLTRKLFPLRELEADPPNSVTEFPLAEFKDADCLESTCVHYYRVRLNGDVVVRLSMKVAFGSILELLDVNANPLEKAASEIRSRVKPDRYIIRVSTQSRTYGSYVLTAGAAGN